MNGVIIFADDDVFSVGKPENELFNSFLKSEEELAIIPISTLENLSSVLKSVSTIRCLILDWTFEKEIEGFKKPENPLSILIETNIYSLIYIYSREALSDNIKEELNNKFGNKIRYREKNTETDFDNEVSVILKEIKSLEEQNKHMQIPKLWSQTINKSVQELFGDFEQATDSWIAQIKDSAKKDGSDGASEVIGVFQNVLSETLIQCPELRSKIDALVSGDEKVTNDKVAQLYRHIMYLKIHKEMPMTTGDIFKFADDYFGILISPECELSEKELSKKESDLAFLMISHCDYKNLVEKRFKNVRTGRSLTEKEISNYRKLFNNGELSIHILPSFPFDETNNKAGMINFRTGFKLFGKNAIENNRTNYRLLAPYIHQLRQRFLSSFGRYGVSEYPESLKDHNLYW